MKQLFRIFILPAICVVFLNMPIGAGAEEPGPLPHAAELTGKLGWTPEEAFSSLGAPLSMFSYRGLVPTEDNVVFYYPDHLYLFWFQDRIWQLRVDERWSGVIDGLHMGMSLSEVTELWGPPINDWDEQPTWTLPDRGYPVRVRLYFADDGKLNDLYVYRSDW